jgi:hypothetical protein
MTSSTPTVVVMSGLGRPAAKALARLAYVDHVPCAGPGCTACPHRSSDSFPQETADDRSCGCRPSRQGPMRQGTLVSRVEMFHRTTASDHLDTRSAYARCARIRVVPCGLSNCWNSVPGSRRARVHSGWSPDEFIVLLLQLGLGCVPRPTKADAVGLRRHPRALATSFRGSVHEVPTGRSTPLPVSLAVWRNKSNARGDPQAWRHRSGPLARRWPRNAACRDPRELRR